MIYVYGTGGGGRNGGSQGEDLVSGRELITR